MLNQSRLLCALVDQWKKLRGRKSPSVQMRRRRAFLEPLESRTVLTVPAPEIVPGPITQDPLPNPEPGPPTSEVANPQAFLSPEGYLVVYAATSAEYNNKITVENNVDDDLVITDEVVPFDTTLDIPGATLSANGHVLTIPKESITGQRIYLFGGGGDDTLTVDLGEGNPILAGGLMFDGGSQNTLETGDGIILTGGAVENADYEFINEHDGSITLDGMRIGYTGLEPVTDNLDTVNRSFTFTGAAETITISDVTGPDGLTRINSTLGELVDFAVPTTSLTVITNGGDTTNIISFDTAFNTPLVSLQGTTSTNTYNLGAANIIPDATALSLTGNVDFNLNNFSEQIGSLASTDATPTVTLSAGQTLTVGDATNTTFSGVIGGPGNFTKVGAGTLTLTGLNTYTGVTAFSGGVLAGNTVSDYGVPSSFGARAFAQETAAGDGMGWVFRSGTMRFIGSAAQSTNRQIRVQTTGGTIDASGTVAAATLTFSYSGANINWFDTPGQRTLFLTGTNTGANTFAQLITDQGANPTNLTKRGAGTWFVTNPASTYTGITAFEGGIMNGAVIADSGVPSSFGARAAAQETAAGDGIGFVFRGGTMQYTGATPMSTNRQIRVQTTGGTIDASGTVATATLSFTYNAANTNWFDTPGARTLFLTGSNTGNNTFAHLITDQGANPTNLTKRGAGTWFVTNPASTYTGITAFEGGIMNGAVIADSGVPSSFGARAAAQETAAGDGIGFVFRGGTMQYTGATPMSTNRQIRVQTTGGAIDASGTVPTATLSFTYNTTNTNWFDTGGVRTFTLTGNNTGANTFAHIVANQAANATNLTKSGTGTWVVSGANTYTGVTTISGGTLKNGSATTFTGTSSMSMSGNGVFDLNGFNATVTNVAASATTNTITNNGANATFRESAQASTISALVTNGTGVLTFEISNANSGVTPFLLTSPNTFSGGLVLLNSAAGTRLRITGLITTVGSPGAITSSPFGTGAITIGTAVTDKAQILFDSVNNNTLVNNIIFNTPLGSDVVAGIRVDTTGHVLSGTMTANLGRVKVAGAGSLSFTGQITGTNGIDILAVGGVTLNNVTASPNNYGGTTMVAASGRLNLGAANQIPNGAAAGLTQVDGTLNLNGFSETINGLAGFGVIDGISGTPTLTFGDNNATGNEFGGVIRNTAGTLGITKIGTGVQKLSGANTYSGPTNINAGTIQTGVNVPITNFDFESPIINGNTNSYNNASATWTFLANSGLINGNGGGFNPAGLVNGNQNAFVQQLGNFSQSITFPNAGNYTLRFLTEARSSGPNPFNVRIDGTIVGASPYTPAGSTSFNLITINLGAVTAGAHTLMFEGLEPTLDRTSFIDYITITGTGVGNAIPDTSVVTIAASAVLDLANNSETVGPLNGAAGSSVTLGSGSLTINSTAAGTFSGVISGTGPVTKNNTNTQTLAGANTYTGTTTVAAGTLAVTGSLVSAPTVQSGATLTGTGSTGLLTVNSGGTHAPGTNIGIGTVNGNYVENGALQIQIGSPTAAVAGVDYDQVKVLSSGSVAIGASATLNVTYTGAAGTFNPNGGQVYVIIDNDGTVPGDTTGTFTGLPGGSTVTVDGKNLTIQYNGGDGNDVVLIAPNSGMFVDDDYPVSGTVDGDLETPGVQIATMGTNAFQSIAALLAANPSYSGIIVVNGGTYASAALAGGGAVTLRLVQDLTNAEANVVVSSLSGAANDAIVTRFVNVANANLIVESGSFAGVISGSGDVVKQNTGTVTLSGANTYTGATIVNGGVLSVGDVANSGTASHIGSGSSVTISGNSVLQFTAAAADAMNRTVNLAASSGANSPRIEVTNAAGDLQLTGTVAGAGQILGKIGAGSLSLETGSTTTIGTLYLAGGVTNIRGSASVTATQIAVGASPFFIVGGGGGVLNIQGTATITTGTIHLGENNGGPAQTNAINQSGGAVTVTGNSGENAGIRLGHWPNESSTYHLSGGTLSLTDAAADIAIATDGNGTFNQTGGTLNVPGIIVDHRNATGSASLNLTGGTSTIGARGLRVADSTTAVIGGTANVTSNSIAIGEFANSSLSIGGSANVNVSGAVTLGTAAAISGDLTITSTGTISFGSLRVGRGTATITGANLTSTGVSIVGTNRSDEIPGMGAGSNATGILNIGSGSFTTAGLVMGNANGGTVVGTVNQSGGMVTTTADAGEANGLRMGHWPTGTANYNLSAGTLNVNGGFALSTATDGTGVFTQTGGTANVTQLDLNSRVSTGGNGTFTLNGGTFNVGSGGIVTDGGGGPYTANLGGGILRATADWSSILNFNLTNAVGPAIIDTNGFNVIISGVLSGAGGLTKNTGAGNLTLSGVNTYTGATNVNAGALVLSGGAAILDTAGAVNVGLGGTLQLLANETVSSYAGAGEIGAGTNDSNLNLGAFTFTTTGNMALGNVTTTTGGSLVSGGNITDADDDNNVTGTNLVLQAATGIGTSANPLETTLASIEASGGTGGVFIANTGNLVIGGIGPMVGVSATGTGINVSTAGSLTVNENVAASSAGASTTLATIDATAAGQDLLISGGVTVSSAASSVTISSGDNATITGNLTAATTATVNVDATNADPVGGTLGIAGNVITAPGGGFINGDTNDDTFNVRPQTAATLTIDGKAPFMTLTGDVLNLDLIGAVNPQLALGGIGAGTWTFDPPLQTINYISIEVMNTNVPYHLTLNANTAAFGNTGVPDQITVRQNGVNFVVERTGAATVPDNDDVGVIFQGAMSSILSFTYLGSSDADTLTVSDIGGLPQFGSTVPSIPDNANLAGVGSILFDGNGGADDFVMNLTGANATLTYAIGNGTGAAGTEGEVLATSGAQSLQAYFVDTELTERTGTGATPGALQIIGDAGVNVVAITASGVNSVVSPTGYTPLSFSGNNFSAITIDALGSGDTIDLVSFGSGQTNNPPITLNGGLGDDTLRVQGTSGNTGAVTLNGNAGSDAFVLQTVDNIVGPVIVDGTDGSVANNNDTLTISDTTDATGDTVLVGAVNAATSGDYRVEGITSTAGHDVVFRNIDTLTYTGTAGNDTIDAQFVNTTPGHDLNTATLNGWTGGDQFLLFTSDQIGGTSPTPTGMPSGVSTIALNGDAPGNPNAGDGNDVFGQTAPGIIGTGAGNVGLLVADSVRGIRPSVTTGISINGGQPTAPVGTLGDSVGDVLNLDLSGLPAASSFVLATLSGVINSPGLQSLSYAQIEDLNFISGNQLLNLQMGDTLVRGSSGPDSIIFSKNPTPADPTGTRVRLNATFVDFPMSGKTLTYSGDANDYITHANVTFPMESHGEGGDDYIAGGMGNDYLIGGQGNDQINASGGNNIVVGDDELTPAGAPSQDSAIGGNDVLSALSGNDVFYGGGGNDQVSPGAGNDYLYGGEGDDILDGNLGDDRVYGGGGNDVLAGSSGNDLLSGAAGNDLLMGADGNDVLIGGTGADSLDGGNGDDLIITGSVANESSSWTSTASTTTFGPGIYSRPTDNDAALLLLLNQWSLSGDRSSLTAVTNDNTLDLAWGYTGNDDFSATANEVQDFNASGMGTDETF